MAAKAALNIGSVTMPAGKYYVGDPCYSVPGHRWMEWLEAAKYDEPGIRYLVADLDGRPVLGIGTMFGDGEYPGDDGNSYPVDAGLIGVVPVELADVTFSGGVQEVDFPGDFQCCWDDSGIITLGHIEIDTDPDDQDWS